MLRFKFHQNWTINDEFYFLWGKILSRGPKGGRVARFQKIKNPYTERWSQPTAKISAS